MKLFCFVILFTVIVSAVDFSEELYDKFLHYARYSALLSCITHGNISEGLFRKGACDLKFCHSLERNREARIVKVDLTVFSN